ncbi:MAG: hypothetical protein K2H60_13840 [Muribaculaceae bacterium]|nr:hypothetical protein [Muribaculaceae bacterium]
MKKVSVLRNIVWKFRKFRRTFKGVNYSKTLYINFKTQSFKTAIKLPILIYGKLAIPRLSGQIILKGPIQTGRFRIGYNSDQFSASKGSAMFNLTGKIISYGKFFASIDVLIQVAGTLELEDCTFFGNSSKLRCFKYIKFGIGSRMVSECQAFDTNFHYMRNIETGEVYPHDGKIIVGNYCWIGNRTTLSKGTVLPDYTIVASNSLCNRDFSNINIIAPMLGGMPAKPIGKGGMVRIFDVETERKIIEYFKSNPNAKVYMDESGLKDQHEALKASFKML